MIIVAVTISGLPRRNGPALRRGYGLVSDLRRLFVRIACPSFVYLWIRAVIYGHVNATDGGPGVFADIQSLGKGDHIQIARNDGTTAVLVTDRGEQHSKASFPTEKVYGNTEAAELWLIACDDTTRNRWVRQQICCLRKAPQLNR